MSPRLCPTPDELSLWLREDPSSSRSREIDDHVDGCPDCQSQLERITACHVKNISTGPLGPKFNAISNSPIDFLDTISPLDELFANEFGTASTAAMLARLPEIPGLEVLQLLGRGGMGRVYLARELATERLVAVKTLSYDRDDDPKLIARFRSEAKALAALNHPNIVRFYEVFEVDGRPALKLEYIAGGNLAEYLRNHDLSIVDITKMMEQIARGIGAAHQSGITHRDLKPANVLMDETTPRITDFGLALNSASGERLTSTSDLFGTPEYMAPELFQQGAQSGSRASDIYALGVILYELLTGDPPFVADSLYVIMQMATSQEPVPPHQRNPAVSERLSAICLKALAKLPSDRFQTAEEFADCLKDSENQTISVASRKVSQQRATFPHRRKTWQTTFFGVLLLIGISGVTIWGRHWLSTQLTKAQGNVDSNVLSAGSHWQGTFAFLPAPADRVDGDFELEIESQSDGKFAGIYYSEHRQYAWRIAGSIQGSQVSWTFTSAIRDNAEQSVVGQTVVTGTVENAELNAVWQQQSEPPSRARLTGRLVNQRTDSQTAQ